VILSIIDILSDAIGGVLEWILVGALLFLLDLYRRFKSLRRDVDDLDRYLTGDDLDPDAPGLLEKVDDVDDEVCAMREDMEQHHRDTDRKLERLLGNRDE
jgi:hypothetical protein